MNMWHRTAPITSVFQRSRYLLSARVSFSFGYRYHHSEHAEWQKSHLWDLNFARSYGFRLSRCNTVSFVREETIL